MIGSVYSRLVETCIRRRSGGSLTENTGPRGSEEKERCAREARRRTGKRDRQWWIERGWRLYGLATTRERSSTTVASILREARRREGVGRQRRVAAVVVVGRA